MQNRWLFYTSVYIFGWFHWLKSLISFWADFFLYYNWDGCFLWKSEFSFLLTAKSTMREVFVSSKSCAICKTSPCLFPKRRQCCFWKGCIHEVARRMPHRLKRRSGARREYTFSLPCVAQWSSTVNTKATVCQCAEESNQLPQWQESLKSASNRNHRLWNKAKDQNWRRHVSMESEIVSFLRKKRSLESASTEWKHNSKHL